ncbi:MAG TPA: hypothetical protein VL096_04995 [Pirellulaceae bacterium]|nr:hypothetical protein [Pirellulaceae bacterium]
MNPLQREQELRAILRHPRGVQELCDIYRGLSGQMPPVGVTGTALLKAILAYEASTTKAEATR